ncbi:MAG TPA: thioredoxin-disulfide reductase [Vicinamibacterales bacterium]|nr:thioredoxin-disulfide reductase [Vicinamibacterales bacterium]
MADRRVTIIGSGPAGLTAALYTARANLKPLLVEGLEAGGQLMLTTMVENYPGFRKGIDGPELMAEMREQALHFGTDVVQGNVERVDLRDRPFSLAFSDGKTVTTDALIIATGASARWLEIGCDRKLAGRGVSTCATCDGYFFRGKPIAVVGGGDSAMEEAIYLTRFASKVTVIHRRDSLRASKIMQDKAYANPKIEFIWDSEIADISDLERGEVTGIAVRHLKTGSLTNVALDGVFIAIGHTPNTALFRGQIELDEAGYVCTHHGTKTSCPGVFAAGDVQDHIYRQAVTAAGSGCMAAIDAERYLDGLPIPDETTDIAASLAAPPVNEMLKP